MPLTNCKTKSNERFLLCFLDLWRLSGILSKPLGKASWCSGAFVWSSGGFITRPIGAAQQAAVALLVAFIRYRFVCSQGGSSQLSNVNRNETKTRVCQTKWDEGCCGSAGGYPTLPCCSSAPGHALQLVAVVDLPVVIPPYIILQQRTWARIVQLVVASSKPTLSLRSC